jgi:hypothetical protein
VKGNSAGLSVAREPIVADGRAVCVELSREELALAIQALADLACWHTGAGRPHEDLDRLRHKLESLLRPDAKPVLDPAARLP